MLKLTVAVELIAVVPAVVDAVAAFEQRKADAIVVAAELARRRTLEFDFEREKEGRRAMRQRGGRTQTEPRT